jgi:hypothetical protein
MLKGSRGRMENVVSIPGTTNQRFRDQLVRDGILAAQRGMLVLTRDCIFAIPSMAWLKHLKMSNMFDIFRPRCSTPAHEPRRHRSTRA